MVDISLRVGQGIGGIVAAADSGVQPEQENHILIRVEQPGKAVEEVLCYATGLVPLARGTKLPDINRRIRRCHKH